MSEPLPGEECDCSLGTYPHPPHPPGLSALPPVLCRLEYWVPAANAWNMGHAGHNLLFPRRYLTRLAANGKIGRVTLLETGQVLQDEYPDQSDPAAAVCMFCGEAHPAPYDGRCLI